MLSFRLHEQARLLGGIRSPEFSFTEINFSDIGLLPTGSVGAKFTDGG